ncbi:MAG: histone deacetylase [Candidatus Obscuribacterales bacterium]|nr:histone deacetylase [Candidatus Obscuribacterales bacterium]
MSHLSSNLVYSPLYNADLGLFGLNKPFALDRGELVLSSLAKETKKTFVYEKPNALSLEEALLVHSQAYLDSLKLTETWLEIMELDESDYFPEKAVKPLPELLHDILLKCGGTKRACELALEHSLAANLGGGYHHAFPNQGRGFCVLHDIAIAVKSLQKRKLVKKVLLVDLDFHQGDGSAVVFKNDPDVFTFSVHSAEGWPEEKQASSLDIEIKQGEENLYQEKLEAGLDRILSSFAPDMVIYVAGSDPYELDVLPGTKFMRMSLAQLKQRDEHVIDRFKDLNIPLAMVFAGGYGPDVWQVHFNAVRHLLRRSDAIGNTRS